MQDLSGICRDERCDRIEVHAFHEIVGQDIKLQSRVRPPRGAKAVWQQAAPKALDHSIAKATSKLYPRHVRAIQQIVEDDFGPCTARTIQRRLGRLVERGHILRIDLGRSLFAYLRPGSPLVNDIELMREQLLMSFPDAGMGADSW